MPQEKTDLSEKIRKKIKEIKFRSPQKSEDPKFVEKRLKDVFKDKPKKPAPKKGYISSSEIIKKVASLLNK